MKDYTMNKNMSLLIYLLIFLSLLSLNKGYAQNIEKSRIDYKQIKSTAILKMKEIKSQYQKSHSAEERNKLIQNSKEFLFTTLTDDIFPAWYGTPWDYNGTSRVPGKGEIACGTFVIYTLQDAGFLIPSNMAKQPSENIIKNLTASSAIKRFSNHPSMKDILKWIYTKEEGLFIVGMDFHVGYIIYNKNKITFCHSNYYKTNQKVIIQNTTEKSPLTDSKYVVIGKILTDEMIIKWMFGQSFPVKYDYFSRSLYNHSISLPLLVYRNLRLET